MSENDVTGDTLDASIKIHRLFGPGMLESVYEQLLEIELRKRGHMVERQKPISFEYEGVVLENAFRLDMHIDGKVIVELKSVEKMSSVFMKQLKTYHEPQGRRSRKLRHGNAQRRIRAVRQ